MERNALCGETLVQMDWGFRTCRSTMSHTGSNRDSRNTDICFFSSFFFSVEKYWKDRVITIDVELQKTKKNAAVFSVPMMLDVSL